MTYHLILASLSPRRKELLGHLKIPFTVIPSNVDETEDSLDPITHSQNVALKKAEFIQSKNQKSDSVIVSADTIVVLDNVIYGKPKDQNEACEYLKKLSGRWHQVYTSFVILFGNKKVIKTVKTEVKFLAITPTFLSQYLKSNESLDKAGAYGIQGEALLFIESINGSYSNVVGFPLSDFLTEFQRILNLNYDNDDWRGLFS